MLLNKLFCIVIVTILINIRQSPGMSNRRQDSPLISRLNYGGFGGFSGACGDMTNERAYHPSKGMDLTSYNNLCNAAVAEDQSGPLSSVSSLSNMEMQQQQQQQQQRQQQQQQPLDPQKQRQLQEQKNANQPSDYQHLETFCNQGFSLSGREEAEERSKVLRTLVQHLYVAQARVQLEATEIRKAQAVASSAQAQLEEASNQVRTITASLHVAQQDVAASAIRAQIAQLQLAAHDQLLFAARQDVDSLSSQMVGLQAAEGILQPKMTVDLHALLDKLRQPLQELDKPTPVPAIISLQMNNQPPSGSNSVVDESIDSNGNNNIKTSDQKELLAPEYS